MRDIRQIIADDGFAIGFQSLGQYRSALLAILAQPPTDQPAAGVDDLERAARVCDEQAKGWTNTRLSAKARKAEAEVCAMKIRALRHSVPCAAQETPKVTLAECPPGLFMFDGTLGFKSEYRTDARGFYQTDAYVVASGEYFWGRCENQKEREQLMVQPIVELSALRSTESVAKADGERFIRALQEEFGEDYSLSDIALAFDNNWARDIEKVNRALAISTDVAGESTHPADSNKGGV